MVLEVVMKSNKACGVSGVASNQQLHLAGLHGTIHLGAHPMHSQPLPALHPTPIFTNQRNVD